MAEAHEHAAGGMGEKKDAKPKKRKREMHIKEMDDKSYHMQMHHADPEQEPTEATAADQDGMMDQVAAHMGNANPGKKMAEPKHNPSLYRALHHLRKGGLHRALGVPEGQKIPAAKLASARNSENPHIRHMANFAATLKGFSH